MKMETNTDNSNFACSHYFGFLSQLSGERETPDECLTCKKLLECKSAKSETTPRRIASETLVTEEVKQADEDHTVDTAKKEPEETKEFETRTAPFPTKSPGNQFVVEDMGILYTSWTYTVCINCETLSSWCGKDKRGKIAEVDIQTNAGRKMRCKVMASKDSRKGTIMIPDKIQLSLETKKGELVRVEPIIVLEKEDKIKGIAHALSDLLKRQPTHSQLTQITITRTPRAI